MAISQAGGYAAVFVTLVVIAMSALGILKTDVARHFDRDAYFAARNSQSPLRLALSYFVTGIGGWVVFTVPLIGATAGSLGVAGYALSAIVPLLILSFIAPFMRRKLPRGVTFADYVLKVAHARACATGERRARRARPRLCAYLCIAPRRAARRACACPSHAGVLDFSAEVPYPPCHRGSWWQAEITLLEPEPVSTGVGSACVRPPLPCPPRTSRRARARRAALARALPRVCRAAPGSPAVRSASARP